MQLILASQSLGRKKLLELLGIPFQIIPSTLDEDKIVGINPIETIKLRAKLKGEEVARKITYNIKHKTKNEKPTTYNLPACAGRQPTTYLILSADSGAISGNRLIGKPKDYDDAVGIMQTLSNEIHELVTAVYIIKIKQCSNETMIQNENNNKIPSLENCNIETLEHSRIWQFYDRSYVTFKRLSLTTIKRYLAHTDYKRYAGGYALFDHPQLLKPTLHDLLSGKSYKNILRSADPDTKPHHLEALDLIENIQGSISNVIGLPLEKVIPMLHQLTPADILSKLK